jgi:hypothetical protein
MWGKTDQDKGRCKNLNKKICKQDVGAPAGGGVLLLFVKMNNDDLRLGLFLLVSLHGGVEWFEAWSAQTNGSGPEDRGYVSGQTILCRWMTQFSQSVKMNLSSTYTKRMADTSMV